MAAHHNLGEQFNTVTHPSFRAPYHDELEAAARDAQNYAEPIDRPDPSEYRDYDPPDYDD